MWTRIMLQMRSLVLSAAARRKRPKELRSRPCLLHGCESGGFGRLENGVFRRHTRSLLGGVSIVRESCYCLILNIIYDICAMIFSAKNFKISNDRTRLTRSAVFFIFFIEVHAVGNLSGWLGFGFQASKVEEYVLLSVLLHIFAGLKRSWDQ